MDSDIASLSRMADALEAYLERIARPPEQPAASLNEITHRLGSITDRILRLA